MAPTVRDLGEVAGLLGSPYTRDELAGAASVPALFVRDDATELDDVTCAALRSLPLVTVLVGSELDTFDVCLGGADDADAALAAIEANAARSPVASVALVQLLRASQHLGVVEGLWAESATYSMLQAGPEFAAWLSREGRPRAGEAAGGAPLRVERSGAELVLNFCRPEVRNAYGFEVRDALVEALQLAAFDPGIESVVLRGDGAAFCSGGDLREFGTAADPASAHIVRSLRSAGYWLSTVGPKLRAEIHGACVGSGIELAAFASHVVAAADTAVKLPELSMGLVPGAGGTVSMPRRMGRQRFALLALTGSTLDAATALRWGLVDEIAG